MNMAIGSLFSGIIGGLELGLERAGLGHTVWQVEKDEFCRRILARHWPEAVRFDDVCTASAATLAPVDLICGGFPCQDVSSAGKRAGLSGARSGLWFQFHRIVSELRPQWVVVENVASGARAWVDPVLGGLGELGYACLPIPLGAVDVGAPHRRNRIFIVACHADAQGEPAQPEHAEVAGAPGAAVGGSRAPEFADDCEADAANTLRARREGSGPGARESGQRPTADQWRSPEPRMVRVVHRPARGVDGTVAAVKLPSARKRIAALGNSVVPQCAEVVGHVIRQLEAA